eukprot:CAMPEP_0115866510 /NCGR_PEP_ID=MMETSP0287-20121206/20287_1 /TAXON_ID=412157 /ORGANISM="Chrysochromulina rotalis, Strain UIO044" /LENGTH=695 /DNA_ID=CAMNT_0003321081 /DNA_START=15 /DNA_END=2099 /DNA_ORIENTATION=-
MEDGDTSATATEEEGDDDQEEDWPMSWSQTPPSSAPLMANGTQVPSPVAPPPPPQHFACPSMCPIINHPTSYQSAQEAAPCASSTTQLLPGAMLLAPLRPTTPGTDEDDAPAVTPTADGLAAVQESSLPPGYGAQHAQPLPPLDCSPLPPGEAASTCGQVLANEPGPDFGPGQAPLPISPGQGSPSDSALPPALELESVSISHSKASATKASPTKASPTEDSPTEASPTKASPTKASPKGASVADDPEPAWLTEAGALLEHKTTSKSGVQDAGPPMATHEGTHSDPEPLSVTATPSCTRSFQALGKQPMPATAPLINGGSGPVQSFSTRGGASATGPIGPIAPNAMSALPVPAVAASTPASLRATLEALSPMQRAAIDQAIFFGMDLRTACALCGRSDGTLAPGALGASAVCASSSGNPGPSASLPVRESADALSKDERNAFTGRRATAAVAAANASASTSSAALGATPKVRSAVLAGNGLDRLIGTAGSPPSGATSQQRSSQATNAGGPSSYYKLLQSLLVRALAMSRRAMALTLRSFSVVPWSSAGRLLASFEQALSRGVEALEPLAARAANASLAILQHLLVLALSGTSMAATWLQRMASRALLPLAAGFTNPLLRRLHAARQNRAGRHISNGTGAIASVMAARVVVIGGPIVGSALAFPIRALWFAGLHDLRLFVAVAAIALLALLQLYKW